MSSQRYSGYYPLRGGATGHWTGSGGLLDLKHKRSVRRSVGHREEESVETQRIQLNLTEAPCLRIVPVLSDCFPETCGVGGEERGGRQTGHQ